MDEIIQNAMQVFLSQSTLFDIKIAAGDKNILVVGISSGLGVSSLCRQLRRQAQKAKLRINIEDGGVISLPINKSIPAHLAQENVKIVLDRIFLLVHDADTIATIEPYISALHGFFKTQKQPSPAIAIDLVNKPTDAFLSPEITRFMHYMALKIAAKTLPDNDVDLPLIKVLLANIKKDKR